MLNLDPEKLVIIMAVALIVLGPQELPRVARELGRWTRLVQDVRARVQAEVTSLADSVVNPTAEDDPPAASATPMDDSQP